MTDKKKNLVEIAKKKRHLALIEKMQTGTLTKQEINELDNYEKGSAVKTMKEVAEVLEVSYRTVQRWKKEGMPITKDGFYDLPSIKKWNEERESFLSAEELKNRLYWQTKMYKHKAHLLEIDVKKAQGELMPRQEVEKGWAMRVAAVRAEFMALPDRLAPLLAMKEPREIKEILFEGIIEITDEFAGVKK